MIRRELTWVHVVGAMLIMASLSAAADILWPNTPSLYAKAGFVVFANAAGVVLVLFGDTIDKHLWDDGLEGGIDDE